MAYIKCENLKLGYDGRVITEGIHFEVNKGDYLCILGENGAGKSTLMKTLLHLLEKIDGEIVYGDGLKPYEIGYLPQQTLVQRDFPASVEEIVMSGNLAKLGLRPFYNAKEKALAKENMERMQVYELRKKCYRNLSGGQQQRVLLARALCATGKLLLLDEPVSGLDPKVTVDFYRQIKELNDSGVSIIMISHDMTAAMMYSSHILHIGKRQLFFGTTKDYMDDAAYRLLSHQSGNCGCVDLKDHEKAILNEEEKSC